VTTIGTLLTREQTKDFVKFLSLVVIRTCTQEATSDNTDSPLVYLGFLTTFVLLARDQFKPAEMVRHCCQYLHAVADYIAELDSDQGLFWVGGAV
jgi:hypothetical protein